MSNFGPASAITVNTSAIRGSFDTNGNLINLLGPGDVVIPLFTSAGGTLTGPLLVPDGSAAAPSYGFAGQTNLGMYRGGLDALGIAVGGSAQLYIQPDAIQMRSTTLLAWTNGNAVIGSRDVVLNRDGPGQLAQRNGVNPQSFKLTNNWIDASNNEYGVMDWTTTANALTIGTFAAGTGTGRDFRLRSASGLILVGNTLAPTGLGTIDFGSAALSWKRLYIDYTNTASIGAVTINKAAGRVNLAAAGTSLVVTNSLVTANSHIFLNATNAPGNVVAVMLQATPTAGSFTITAVPAVTNQTAIDFFIVSAD